MYLFFKFMVVLCVNLIVECKNLHLKESQTEKNGDLQFQDFYNYDDNVYITLKNRYIRHVDLVTESVLDHLLKEIHNKYPQSKNDSRNAIPKMMQRLKMKLNRHMNKKNRKQKKLHRKNSKNGHLKETTPV